ncbi:MAG: histidine phosphatase family protein [Deltaproteobacteria bacterium]|nr:histidine phosphatase family protein [Deltaproteobacteria bacterium]
MSTTILLVRHGETDWNRDKIFRGIYDIPLNDNGREQAKLAAKALKICKIDFAYTSPLSRAAETAEIILKQHNIKASISEGLIDFDYGNWTGQKDVDVAKNWPEEHAAWSSRPDSLRIPGGDTLKEVFDRAFGCMEELAQKHDDQTVALFAHRVVNKLLVIGALGIGLDRFSFIMQGNCCVNKFERTKKGYIIDFINDTAHIRNARANLLKEDF